MDGEPTYEVESHQGKTWRATSSHGESKGEVESPLSAWRASANGGYSTGEVERQLDGWRANIRGGGPSLGVVSQDKTCRATSSHG